MKVIKRLRFAHVFEDFSARIGKVEQKHWFSKFRIIGVDYMWKKWVIQFSVEQYNIMRVGWIVKCWKS